MEIMFLTTMELFGSPLNCSVTGGITSCSAFPENEIFGAVINSFLFRWTSSYIVNPEYELEDMLKEVLHALASSEFTETPFMVVLILPVWDDMSWSSSTVRGHGHPNPSGTRALCTGAHTVARSKI
jgi:hypothetical protein